MAIDPVCGMEVGKTEFKSKMGGKDMYFYCPQCKSRFDIQPSKFSV